MDTVIGKKHYSHRGYYPTKYSRINLETDETQTLLCLGNYENGKKTGHWIYFYADGSISAEGDYKDGQKIRVWTYYSANRNCSYLKYPKKHEFTDQVFISDSGYIELRDVANAQVLYINGRKATVCYSPVHILD